MKYWRVVKKELAESLITLKSNTYFSISVDKENWLFIAKIEFNKGTPLFICSSADNTYRLIEADANIFAEKIFFELVAKNTFVYANLDVKSFESEN